MNQQQVKWLGVSVGNTWLALRTCETRYIHLQKRSACHCHLHGTSLLTMFRPTGTTEVFWFVLFLNTPQFLIKFLFPSVLSVRARPASRGGGGGGGILRGLVSLNTFCLGASVASRWRSG